MKMRKLQSMKRTDAGQMNANSQRHTNIFNSALNIFICWKGTQRLHCLIWNRTSSLRNAFRSNIIALNFSNRFSFYFAHWPFVFLALLSHSFGTPFPFHVRSFVRSLVRLYGFLTVLVAAAAAAAVYVHSIVFIYYTNRSSSGLRPAVYAFLHW